MISSSRTVVIGVILVASMTGTAAVAATFRSGERPVVAADEVIEDDLYITGETVTVDGVVQGDLVAMGREVVINGTVEGDLMAAAQAVLITGEVQDARIAGMALKLGEGARVTEDLIGASFSLEMTSDSSVDGLVIYSGYQAVLAGAVGGAVSAAVGALELAGPVAGDVKAEITGNQGEKSPASFMPSPLTMPNVAGGLKVTESARIGGRLIYTAPSEGEIASGDVISGGVEHRRPEAKQAPEPSAASVVLSHIKKPIALLIIGLLMLWLAPRWVRGLVESLEARPLPSLGWGVVTLIAVPVAVIAIILVALIVAVVVGMLRLSDLAALVVVLSLIGEGILIVAFWVAVAFLAPIAVSLVVGRWVVRRARGGMVGDGVLPLVIGLVAVAVLSAVPVIGTLVGWLVVLLGLGAVLIWLLQGSRQRITA
jgi:cytoskeletal protein CcmA (bactofilin family)